MANEFEVPHDWRYPSIGELEAEGVIAEIQDGNHGERHPKASEYVPIGVPFVMAKDLEDGKLNLTGCSFIPRELADSLRIGFAKPGDVLLTHKATMGRVAVVPEGFDYVMLTPQVTYYRIGDPEQLSNTYLKYAFLGRDFQHQLNSDSDQSTRKYIGITAQRRLRIPFPKAAEQRAIAHILGTLDDKIYLNRRMNETLDAMARALFKSWFVDFDPVRAKIEDPDPSLPPPLADLFPDSFEDSELGEIPRGWKVGRLRDTTKHLRDQENPLSSPDALFHHFSIPAYDEEQSPKVEDGGSIKSLKWSVPPGAVLLSKLNPEIARVWLVDVRPNERSVCSTEFLVLSARPPFTRTFIYCLARSPLFRQQIEGLVTGTSKSHQRAQVGSILDLAVVIPPSAIVAAFDRCAESLLVRTLECRRESRTLAALRDQLLPKLVSGELRLKDAESLLPV